MIGPHVRTSDDTGDAFELPPSVQGPTACNQLQMSGIRKQECSLPIGVSVTVTVELVHGKDGDGSVATGWVAKHNRLHCDYIRPHLCIPSLLTVSSF